MNRIISKTRPYIGLKAVFFRYLLFMPCLLLAVAAQAQQPQYIAGRILVKPKSHLAEAEFSRRINARGAFQHRTLHHTNVRVLALAAERTESVLAELQNDPDIEFAERDYIAQACLVPNDPFVVSGDEWHLAKIQALPAWDFTIGASNVLIAVLDSGVNAAHPDLAGRLLPGYDFVNNDFTPSDDFGHGTAVAGTLVANGNNNLGVAGVAYGCTVLPIKVMDQFGSASHSTIAQGIEYAVEHGARIINLSMGGDWPSSTLQNAINYAWSNNVVIVAAAGNNGGTAPQYPGACEHVLAVGASEPDDSRAPFSSYGTQVTLFAPGDNIWTTQRDLNNPYGSWKGTSFSSPVVAAVAALVLSLSPSLSNTQIVDILQQTADHPEVAGYDSLVGRINALRAVGGVSPSADNPLPNPPAEPIITPAPPAPAPVSGQETVPPAVTQVISAPLVLQTNGLGRLMPGFRGTQIEVGKSYQIRAVPGLGQLFAGWSGGLTSQSPVLCFTMQTNLTLVANFVPNPFPAVRGRYTGLMANTNGITPDNSGYFALTIANSGAFSGNVLAAGKRYGFTGKFDLAGGAKVDVRRGLAAPLALSLQVDLTQLTSQVAGRLSDGNWTSELLGDRNVFNASANPAQQAGLHSFILERAQDGAAAATGFSRISLGGGTNVRGKLSDGRPFSTASALAKNGDCPFYLSRNHGTELVIGWLNFPAGPGLAASGTVLWVSTGTNAFASTLYAAAGQR